MPQCNEGGGFLMLRLGRVDCSIVSTDIGYRIRVFSMPGFAAVPVGVHGLTDGTLPECATNRLRRNFIPFHPATYPSTHIDRRCGHRRLPKEWPFGIPI